jgi:hypothetical protein
VRVELLHAVVELVGDVDMAGIVDRDAVGDVELARRGAGRAPRAERAYGRARIRRPDEDQGDRDPCGGERPDDGPSLRRPAAANLNIAAVSGSRCA